MAVIHINVSLVKVKTEEIHSKSSGKKAQKVEFFLKILVFSLGRQLYTGTSVCCCVPICPGPSVAEAVESG
jgi:hypothetical protein